MLNQFKRASEGGIGHNVVGSGQLERVQLHNTSTSWANIRRQHLIPVLLKHCDHGTVARTGFGDSAFEFHFSHQHFCPSRLGRVKIILITRRIQLSACYWTSHFKPLAVMLYYSIGSSKRSHHDERSTSRGGIESPAGSWQLQHCDYFGGREKLVNQISPRADSVSLTGAALAWSATTSPERNDS